MSPRKEIRLSTNAIERVIKLIHDVFDAHVQTCSQHDVQTFTGLLCPELLELRTFLLGSISAGIADRILKIILKNKQQCKSKVHILIIPLLLSSQSKEMSFQPNKDYFIPAEEEQNVQILSFILLKTIANYCPVNIVRLTLSISDVVLRVINDYSQIFETAMANMTTLEIFVLQMVPTNMLNLFPSLNTEFPRSIGQHCKKLQELHIEGGEFLKMAFEKLCFSDYPKNTILNEICDSLEVLSFSNTIDSDPTPEEVLIFLQHFPNIRSLGKYEHVVDVMNLSLKMNIPLPKHFSHILLFRINEQCRSISHYFQNIKIINIATEREDMGSRISAFESVRVLKYGCLANVVPNFLPDLKIIGRNLTVFELCKPLAGQSRIISCQTQPPFVDLALISQYCPKLKELKLTARVGLINNTDEANFPNLETFVYTSNWLAKGHLNFLSRLTLLRKLVIIFAHDITDEDIYLFLNKNSFRNLEKLFIIDKTELTIKSIRYFIDYCPNLVAMGDIRCFKNETNSDYLTENEFHLLRKEVKERNIDIDLFYFKIDLSQTWRRDTVMKLIEFE